MPTRGSGKSRASSTPAKASQATAGHVPAFAASRSVMQTSAANLRLPGVRAAWTWYASPWDVGVQDGHYRPLLKKANHTPGENGNNGNQHYGEGTGAWLQSQGYVMIPHTIPAVVDGQPYQGEDSNYLKGWKQRAPDGRELFTYYEHAWARPIQTPAGLRWEWDDAGLHQLYSDVIALITGGRIEGGKVVGGEGLNDEQKRLACRTAIESARGLLDRQDPRAKRMLVKQVLHIPEDMRPLDLTRALEKYQSEYGDVEPTK